MKIDSFNRKNNNNARILSHPLDVDGNIRLLYLEMRYEPTLRFGHAYNVVLLYNVYTIVLYM